MSAHHEAMNKHEAMTAHGSHAHKTILTFCCFFFCFFFSSLLRLPVGTSPPKVATGSTAATSSRSLKKSKGEVKLGRRDGGGRGALIRRVGWYTRKYVHT